MVKASVSKLHVAELALIFAILVQSLAIIFIYENLGLLTTNSNTADDNEVVEIVTNASTSIAVPHNDNDIADATNNKRTNGRIQHTTPNPGGLILSSSFSYMQDPREVHRRRPLPHILPTFENIYHFVMTVHHYGLHAIIFHDHYSFNETFVKTHTSEYIKFVRVAAPTFDNNEPIISPNDFRYVVFNKWLKENSHNESGKILVNGVDYNWFMIADNDIFFQRNPFPLLDDYSNRLNLTFFGSFDGGQWKDEEVRLQRKLFRNCYGRGLILSWKDDLELATPNGNCGLWAGRHKEVSCILQCMSDQYDVPPVQGKGSKTICDMVTHDFCVHYGGCFHSSKGVYDAQKIGVLWGEATLGKSNELFGPPYGRYRACDWDAWAVVHNRCDYKGPLCFRENMGNLVKFHQNTYGRRCKVDKNGMPLNDFQLLSLGLNRTPIDDTSLVIDT